MSLTAPYKVLVVVASLLLVFTGFYLMDYQPKLAELSDLRQQLQRSRNKLDARRGAIRELDKTAREIERLELELHNLVAGASLPEEPMRAMGEYVEQLETVVASLPGSQVVLESVMPLDDKPAPDGVPAQGFQVNMQGGFDSLGEFFRELGTTNSQRRVIIDRVLVRAGSEPGTLELQLPMTAYLGEALP